MISVFVLYVENLQLVSIPLIAKNNMLYNQKVLYLMDIGDVIKIIVTQIRYVSGDKC